MDTINKIFWDTDRISMITNHINAEILSHYMLQIFIGIEDMVDIKINNKSKLEVKYEQTTSNQTAVIA